MFVFIIIKVNEPWQYTPIEELKKYYWEGYLIVKKGAPYWKYIMHDSFRFDPDIWGKICIFSFLITLFDSFCLLTMNVSTKLVIIFFVGGFMDG